MNYPFSPTEEDLCLLIIRKIKGNGCIIEIISFDASPGEVHLVVVVIHQ